MVGVGLVFEVVSQMRAPRPASFPSRLGIEITGVESAFIMSTRRWLGLVFVIMPAPEFVATPALVPVCSTMPLKALPPSHQCATTAYRQPLYPLTTAH